MGQLLMGQPVLMVKSLSLRIWEKCSLCKVYLFIKSALIIQEELLTIHMHII